MNETQSDKLAAERGPIKKTNVVERYFAELHGDGKLTRVPISHLYFPPGEYMDFQGCGQSQISYLECTRPGVENRRHWVCDFIPAWQMFELTFVPGGDAPPITELIVAVHVKRSKYWRKS